MKLLYLNHVCWEWIFQRPQILALEVEKDFDCTVLNKKFILGRTVAKTNTEPAKRKNVWLLPRGDRIRLIGCINQAIYNLVSRRLASEFDAVWVCHPSVAEGVLRSFRGMVIYDCMDNHVALTTADNRERVRRLEEQLIKRADLIFVSSEKLKESVPGMQDAILVRNGFSPKLERLPVKAAERKEKYQIGYFGTVSSWFDFGLLNDSLETRKNIEYHIIGPVSEGADEQNKDSGQGIVFEGVIEHSLLAKRVQDYDALIMPFVVNDIILSVDPVKMYEYINFGKCVISVWYPEIERFSPFVYFYRDRKEYEALLEKLSAEGFPPKYTEEQREEFLKDNSWNARYHQVRDSLKCLMEKH